ncbi:MAG: DUF5672 family protein [Candidatus Micrarchaeaceae archaeon]
MDKIRKLQLPEIKLNQEKEAVLVEFRNLPHIEFTLRNTIHKLGSEWSYTVVCGVGNLKLVKQICNNISKNIKIIVFDFENIAYSQYSILLVDKKFWQNFRGNKILIYQEDSYIFNSNINEFLKYDYIGAICPWNGIPSVGNGGLSIRTKDVMIKVIEKTIENNREILTSIKFEDVFFTTHMKTLKIGIIAPLEEAEKFSFQWYKKDIETFGCHQPWSLNFNWEDYLYQKLLKDL